MTTNKPGVLGYFAEYQKAGGQFRLSTNHFETRHDAVRFAFIDVRAVPVIRLSDYEALQAEFVIRLDELSARNYELRMGLAEKTSECEKLRKVMSEAYVKGWNDCQKIMMELVSHDWDDQGKCRRCGDRDWHASATCTPKQQPAPDVDVLVGLLEHAQRNTCDGSGALYGTHGQVEQCQWCHERSEALAAHRKQGGGE